MLSLSLTPTDVAFRPRLPVPQRCRLWLYDRRTHSRRGLAMVKVDHSQAHEEFTVAIASLALVADRFI